MDSAGDLPIGWEEEYQIDIIPINIHFRETRYLQGVDLTNEDFYHLVDTNRIIPKTSQHTPQQFIDFYRKVAQLGETILSMHITQHLSGTYESAVIAAREVEGEYNVIPFDSGCGSAVLGYMCREARKIERAGAILEKIMERLNFIRQNINIVLTLNTLDYARMSGRVKTLQAALASILDVKPIIILKDGVLDMTDRVRTRQRAVQRILDEMVTRVGNRLVNVAVVNAHDPKGGEMLLKLVRSMLNCNEIISTELSVAVAANLGPGTLGIVAYPVE